MDPPSQTTGFGANQIVTPHMFGPQAAQAFPSILDRPAGPAEGEVGSLRRYLSIDEYVQVSGLSAATIRRRIKARQLPSFQPGGLGTKILIPTDALEFSRSPSPVSAVTAMSQTAAPSGNDPVMGAPAAATSLSADAPSRPNRRRPQWQRSH